MSGFHRDFHATAEDGLRLYARDYGPRTGEALPVICLPGLARTSEDFHDLAVALSTEAPRARRVLAIDYRGRGRSDRDPDWRNYDIRIETNDVLRVLAAAGIEKAVFVGTSRGGLIAMSLSAVRPTLLAGVVLNDVGPVLEAGGLARIRSYVGKMPAPRSMREAQDILKRLSQAHFPGLTDAQWERQARATWRESENGIELNYDSRLSKTLDGLDLEAQLPDLWPLFEGLKPFPVLAIRGGLSDLLRAKTLQEMEARHPQLTSLTIPDQGHAPLLEGEAVRAAVKRLIEQAEGTS